MYKLFFSSAFQPYPFISLLSVFLFVYNKRARIKRALSAFDSAFRIIAPVASFFYIFYFFN